MTKRLEDFERIKEDQESKINKLLQEKQDTAVILFGKRQELKSVVKDLQNKTKKLEETLIVQEDIIKKFRAVQNSKMYELNEQIKKKDELIIELTANLESEMQKISKLEKQIDKCIAYLTASMESEKQKVVNLKRHEAEQGKIKTDFINKIQVCKKKFKSSFFFKSFTSILSIVGIGEKRIEK